MVSEPGVGFDLLKKLGSLGAPDLKSVSKGEGQSEGTEHVLHRRSSPGDWSRNEVEKSVHQGRTGSSSEFRENDATSRCR